MMRRLLLGSVLALAACQSATVPKAPARADLAAEVQRGDRQPRGKAGDCWAQDITPAVFETVTEQVAVAGTDAANPSALRYQTVTQQRLVRDRETIWFPTPCPEVMTLEFVATLQRALKARGLYTQPLTGSLDAATRAAIRRFQAPLGLDSPLLSLAAARDLGIVAKDVPRN